MLVYTPGLLLVLWATCVAVTGASLRPLWITLIVIAVVAQIVQLARRYRNDHREGSHEF